MEESEIKKDASDLSVKFGIKIYMPVIKFVAVYLRLKLCHVFFSAKHNMKQYLCLAG